MTAIEMPLAMAPAMPEDILDTLHAAIDNALQAAYASGYERGINVGRALGHSEARERPGIVNASILRVLDTIRKITGVHDFSSDQGKRNVHLEVRWAACVLLRDYCSCSFPHIAQILGWRDHTTALNAYRGYESRVNTVTIVHRARMMLENQEAA